MERNQSHIRATREPSMVDLLDRILDKGMVIDVWARILLAGIDFGIRWEACMVVASIDTYLEYAGPIGLLDSVAWRRKIAQDSASTKLGLKVLSRRCLYNK